MDKRNNFKEYIDIRVLSCFLAVAGGTVYRRFC